MPLKEIGGKEVKKDPQFGGQWKIPCLVTFGKNPILGGEWGSIHVWLPLEGEIEASFSPLPIFHPKRFYLNLFFH